MCSPIDGLVITWLFSFGANCWHASHPVIYRSVSCMWGALFSSIFRRVLFWLYTQHSVHIWSLDLYIVGFAVSTALFLFIIYLFFRFSLTFGIFNLCFLCLDFFGFYHHHTVVYYSVYCIDCIVHFRIGSIFYVEYFADRGNTSW